MQRVQLDHRSSTLWKRYQPLVRPLSLDRAASDCRTPHFPRLQPWLRAKGYEIIREALVVDAGLGSRVFVGMLRSRSSALHRAQAWQRKRRRAEQRALWAC